VQVARLGEWCWRRGIPSVRGGGVFGDAPVVIVVGHRGHWFGLLDIGEGPAFVHVDSGSVGHANWWGLVFRGIPRGIRV